MKYKLMNAKELGEFILSSPLGEVYNFALEYPDDMESEPDEHFDTNEIVAWNEWNDRLDDYGDFSGWYGIVKTKVFDSIVVIMGDYGGYHQCIMDIEYDYNEFLEDMDFRFKHTIFNQVSDDHLVCVKLTSVRKVGEI